MVLGRIRISGSALVHFAVAFRIFFSLLSTQASRVCCSKTDEGLLLVEIASPDVFGREQEDATRSSMIDYNESSTGILTRKLVGMQVWMTYDR